MVSASVLVALANRLLVLVKVASWLPLRPLIAPSMLYAEATKSRAFAP